MCIMALYHRTGHRQAASRSVRPSSSVPDDGPCSFPLGADAGEDASDSSGSLASEPAHHAAPVYSDITTFSQARLLASTTPRVHCYHYLLPI